MIIKSENDEMIYFTRSEYGGYFKGLHKILVLKYAVH